MIQRKNKEEQRMELYVHIPFCAQKCNYCDFLSGPAGQKEQEAYVEALLREIQFTEEGTDKKIISVFIGGGTPSILPPNLLEKIVTALKGRFFILPDAEITIETNPGTLTMEKLKAYKKSGINRLSMGLQSTDEKELKMLGRIHTFDQFLQNYRLAREAGFSNINVDLMSAIPGQTPEGWQKNLRTVAGLLPEHISAYSLIVEEGTPFACQELDLPDEEAEYRMYEDTARILAEYGYEQYEISNYAKKGYACVHNTGYWRRREYLGLGLGAASLVEGRRFSNTKVMAEYLENCRTPRALRREETILSEAEEMEEFMFLGLRMTAGVSRKEFEESFGRTMEEVYGKILRKHRELGMLEEKDGRVFLTRQGIHVSNSVMADFLLEN